MRNLSIIICLIFLMNACVKEDKPTSTVIAKVKVKQTQTDTLIIDCNYTFDQAIEGTQAPGYVIDNLSLINVRYYSTDGKKHAGQLLTHKDLAPDIIKIFDYILESHFPIGKAIPIVKYNWNDSLSMQDNNSYSFCYRNVSFSKHATGRAIDINPFFNPIRWKNNFSNKTDQPIGATYNPDIEGTFYDSHPIVIMFRSNGFRWGHSFTQKYDDHHFEK